jgi:hypothetical protein
LQHPGQAFPLYELILHLKCIEIEAQGCCGRLLQFGLNFGSHSSSCICRVQGELNFLFCHVSLSFGLDLFIHLYLISLQGFSVSWIIY